MDKFDPSGSWRGRAKVVVTRANFGCGSSREHAPWALEVNDITCVIAESYARIFRQNMFNGGMLAIELPADKIEEIFALVDKGDVKCTIDINAKSLTFSYDGAEMAVPFTLSQFDEALVKAGGWVEFSDDRY